MHYVLLLKYAAYYVIHTSANNETQQRQVMILALQQIEARNLYYQKENENTMQELNNNIVRMMSKIDGSLNNIMHAIRK